MVATDPAKLPSKFSELIRLGLSDLEKCEKDDRYKISMGDWHDVSYRGGQKVCAVCIAGAVMAQTLDAPYGVNIIHLDFDWVDALDDRGVSISDKFSALDSVRSGHLDRAVARMKLPQSLAIEVVNQFFPGQNFGSFTPVIYREDADEFKSMLRRIADAFENLGY